MAGYGEEKTVICKRAADVESRAKTLSCQLVEYEKSNFFLKSTNKDIVCDRANLIAQLGALRSRYDELASEKVKAKFDALDRRVKCLEIDLGICHKPLQATYNRRRFVLVPQNEFRAGQQILYEDDDHDVGSSDQANLTDQGGFSSVIIPPMSICLGSSSFSSSSDDGDDEGSSEQKLSDIIDAWVANGSSLN
ncbi:hypothetical protein COLO4_08239 [Corchorus olitorius]|uniref:Uncharacterized protein n=1 Tax=Corchorus olitorius TaxID=93759 RepID=A0A1R3KGR7_9ROSI|nr:hypothetical protein COLO4_08239 [Corchorus olitorius]